MPYRLELSPRAQRQLRALPREVQVRLGRVFDLLTDSPRPRGTRKLSGHDDLYRLRAGAYRILYEVHDEVLLVLVLQVGHRRAIYDRLR